MVAESDLSRLSRALRNPARLVVGPTDVTLPFPHGGIPIGPVIDAELEWDAEYRDNRDPSSGAVDEVSRRRVETPRVVLLVEGARWDEDALQATFTKTTRSSDDARIEGSLVPFPVAAGDKILLASIDPQGKCVLFRRPVWKLSFRRSTAFAIDRGAGLPLVLLPTPDSAYATTPFWQVSRLDNLTL